MDQARLRTSSTAKEDQPHQPRRGSLLPANLPAPGSFPIPHPRPWEAPGLGPLLSLVRKCHRAQTDPRRLTSTPSPALDSSLTRPRLHLTVLSSPNKHTENLLLTSTEPLNPMAPRAWDSWLFHTYVQSISQAHGLCPRIYPVVDVTDPPQSH